eukprot:tig00001178_g7386.t1
MGKSVLLPIAGLLAFGTTISLTAKLIYEVKSTGLSGQPKNFEKPWFLTMTMFAGMCFCFPLLRLKQWQERRSAADPERQPLKSVEVSDRPETPKHKHHHRRVFLALIPAVADLTATLLMMSGLVYTTVSINQTLSGANLVFCAIFSIIFLGRRLDKYNWTGLVLCVIGITLVGIAGGMNAEGSEGVSTEEARSKQYFGIGLILVSQMVQASQMVIEEYLLQHIEMEPLEIVGWEGIYGTAICLLVALPLAQYLPGSDEGSFENSFDSMRLIANSGALIGLGLLDTVATLLYNYFAMCVTQGLSAIHRMLLETMRTLSAWLIGLTLYYVVSHGQYGEKWGHGSFTQLLGFVIMVTGTIVYNRSELVADSEEDSSAGEKEPEATKYATAAPAAPPRRPRAPPPPSPSPSPPPVRPPPSPPRPAPAGRPALPGPAERRRARRSEEPRRPRESAPPPAASPSHTASAPGLRGLLRRREGHVGSIPHSLRSGYMFPSSLKRGSTPH